MIKVDVKYLEGKYAVPTNYPITNSNPAPWLITELMIDALNPVKIWIRGDNSCWFRLNQCWVDDKSECDEYIDIKKVEKAIESIAIVV